MQQWRKANGGPLALFVLGVLALVPQPVIGVVLVLLSLLVWLNTASWFPYRVVHESRIHLEFNDAVLTTTAHGPGGRVQLDASVRNGGAPTTLHSWALQPVLPIGTRETVHLADARPVLLQGQTDLGSLAEKTRLKPLERGTERGFLYFGVSPADSDLSEVKLHGVLVLSVRDQHNRAWQLRRSVADLVATGEQKIPTHAMSNPPPQPTRVRWTRG